jgi:hypothetical protein
MPNVKYLIDEETNTRIPLYSLPVNRTMACGRLAVSRSGRTFAVTKTGRVYISRWASIRATFGLANNIVTLGHFDADDLDALDALCLIDGTRMQTAKREAFKRRQRQYIESELRGAQETLVRYNIFIGSVSTRAVLEAIDGRAEVQTRRLYDAVRKGKKK